jgi:hypothetical protein
MDYTLKDEFEGQAEWRREKAKKYGPFRENPLLTVK